MKFEILEEKENLLFKRKEILASVNFGSAATTSKMEMQKAIADHLKVDAESVEISKILSEDGMARGKAWIKVWHEKKVPIHTSKKAAEAAKAAEEKK
jgi:ribosomal protein S24E